ncbi:hypothetical protein OG470_22535 [Micromonospora sp. NBC_00389]|uniref:golvesin C-terminal-like domain-containing protein n=1 Tax=Micromonospora sp. NBC_00389 TaxID=2903586 RepID=UPI002E1C8455
MLFTYEERKSNNKPTKFLRYLTDAAGRKTLTIDYYAKGQAYDYINDTTWARTPATNLTNPKIIDHVSQITDISGRKLTFNYTDKGLLGELIDGAGSTNGTPKKFQFRYDMTQGNKNVKLVKVTDPRGNATDLAYHYPQTGDDPKWHWRTKHYTDRNDKANLTQFAYADPDATNNIRTTVTDAENHSTVYLQDGYGRPVQTTNAKNQTTKLGWDDDHNVTRLEENNGAVSTWQYDQKTGYPTEIKDPEAVENGTAGTVLTYQLQLNGYVAELVEKTSPEGRKHTFGYEPDGDLSFVVDPIGNTTSDPDDHKTSYTYDAWGQLMTATDANNNTTKNLEFHASGYPQAIEDAAQKTTRFGYDVRGNVLKVTDPLLHYTTQGYDVFGRPTTSTVPKDQTAGEFITTPAPVYDGNDNITAATTATGEVATAIYDAADQVIHMLTPIDKPGDPERRSSFTYDKVGNLLTAVEPKGNLSPTAGDFTTINAYDEIYQLTDVVNAGGDKMSYSYDDVGNVVKVVDPVKNATADPADYMSRFEHDSAHRVVKVIDATGKFTTTTYDKDGLVTASTDQLGNSTLMVLDRNGRPEQVKVPHKNVNGTLTHRVTGYGYDEVGNRTKVTSPRGMATANPDDFAQVSVYDSLNHVKESRTEYDPNDARYSTPDKTTFEYDDAGRLTIVSQPPSSGETDRNETTNTYWDNGWTRSSTDPWNIATSYDYDNEGAQTLRKVRSADEDSSSRTMSWQYFPDGKVKARADDGVPVGRNVVLVDNSDSQNVSVTGTWPAATSATNKYGPNYATHAAGTGTNAFTWNLNIPKSGTYQVYARYPTVSGAATNAEYTVRHAAGSAVATVNQSANAGTWVSLGSFSFTEGNTQKITLSDRSGGTVAADAIKLVRDNGGETDAEKYDYTYGYDPNGNLTSIADSSPGARIDSYAITYTGLNQVEEVREKLAGVEKNKTVYGYDDNGAPTKVSNSKQHSLFEYDVRSLLHKITNGKTATDPDAKVTTYSYNDRGDRTHEVKGNGNTVDSTYYLDGLLRTQVENKPNGTLVSEHTIDYDLNANRLRDVSRKMNADNRSAYLDSTTDYGYDPRDRIATSTISGHGAGTETYVHDANNNVISQTVKDVSTTYDYDRNRLVGATTSGITASYNYDPFGRLDTVTALGQVLERNVYDGFDHVIENRKTSGGTTSTTKFTFDPLDRTASKTDGAGGADEKTTTFNYLGLSGEVLDEQVAGEITKSYRYSPWGERLSQVTHETDGTEESSYYGYNPHTDVETLTDAAGDTKATYGYTAYGNDDTNQFTGIDKPDSTDPTKEPYNAYRFNSKRWDQASGTYDMGFRDYSPRLNRFLTRDMYNSALADLDLGLDPWTSNRYAFGGGNPVSAVELDGHRPYEDPPDTSWMNYYTQNVTNKPTTGQYVPGFGWGITSETLFGSVSVYDADGNLIAAEATIRSGGGLLPGESGRPLTDQDLEQRALKWAEREGLLQKGNTLRIDVDKPDTPPCNNCGAHMRRAAETHGMRIWYTSQGTTTVYGDEFSSAHLKGAGIKPITPKSSQGTLFELPPTKPNGGTGKPGGPRGGGAARGMNGTGNALGLLGFGADMYFYYKYGPCGVFYYEVANPGACQPQMTA